MTNEQIDEVVCLYRDELWTLRRIAKRFNTNHHNIKRKLDLRGIIVNNKNRKRSSLTDEHKMKIGISSKGRISWNKNKKMTIAFLYKNMQTHLRYNVSLKWLLKFTDIEKLKYLNRSISRRRDAEMNTEEYKLFIEKFYYDESFNRLFDLWISTKDNWIKPSIDHTIPKSKGGSLDLSNLKFISWFENRAKYNIFQNDWNKMKKNIQYYL